MQINNFILSCTYTVLKFESLLFSHLTNLHLFQSYNAFYNRVIIVLCDHGDDWQIRWRPFSIDAKYTISIVIIFIHGFKILILIILTHYICFYLYLFQSYDV